MAMVLLLSPAKTMGLFEGPPVATGLPRYVDRAEVLLEALRSLGLNGCRELWRCSERLARYAYGLVESADPRKGCSPAVMTFRGMAYQHLAAHVMDEASLAYLDGHLRIVSGLYGILRPFDGVVPYRLEMCQRLAVPPAADLYEFWGDALARAIAEDGADTVVDVASAEYSRAVIPAARRLGLPTVSCEFRTRMPGGRLVSRAIEVKAVRGSFVRWCAEGGLSDVADLAGFCERGYALDPDASGEGRLSFVR